VLSPTPSAVHLGRHVCRRHLLFVSWHVRAREG
jgi:hypothetical protein